MLRAAVLKDAPVLFLENKACYAARANFPGAWPRFLRLLRRTPTRPSPPLPDSGGNVTLVCCGGTLLAWMGAPPDRIRGVGGISRARSIRWRWTNRRLIVPGAPVMTLEEGTLAAGFGAELHAALSEHFPGRMGRSSRLGARELPVAAARGLEDGVLPQAEDVVRCIRALVDPGARDGGA
jgi:pyruvate/2-oxoglutarate/acetoin dehydrogenase E1 component